MSDLVPSLVEGYESRDYLRFDFQMLEVFRDLAEDIEWATPGVLNASVLLFDLIHYRTRGYLRYQVRDPERTLKEVSAIWAGQGSVWIPLSVREIRQAFHGMFGKSSTSSAANFLEEIGIVDRQVPENFASANAPARFRINGLRAKELLSGGGRTTSDPEAGRSYPSSEAPISPDGQAMSGDGQATPPDGQAMSGDGQPTPPDGQAMPGDGHPGPEAGKVLDFFGTRPGSDKGKALAISDPPLYREGKETKGKENSLSRELCRLLAAELDRRLPRGQRNTEAWLEEAELLVDAFPGRFDYLAGMLIWTQQDDWWQDKITNMGALYRNLDVIMSQYQKALSQQRDKEIDQHR